MLANNWSPPPLCLLALEATEPAERAIKSSITSNKLNNKLEKWFSLRGERAHSLKLFCMHDKRFEISKTK